MVQKFTSEQLAKAPAAWMPDGLMRSVKMPGPQGGDHSIGVPYSDPKYAGIGDSDAMCPVTERHDDHDIVIAPNGARIAIRR